MKVVIVDDEQDMRQSISQWLALSGFETETYGSAEEALKEITSDFAGIVISDIRMPGMDGMAFLKRLNSIDHSLPVIMITGHGDVPMAVEAMRIGAFDFLEKPFDPEKMSSLAKRAIQARRLTLDNRSLRRELSDGTGIMRRLVGTSPAMERLREDILDLGQADGHVLITGETGTGKTLVAHALHAVGPRAGKPFVTVTCGAQDEAQLRSLIFGAEENDLARPALEAARGGTLVLEDVETLSDALQARLLSALDEAQSAGRDLRIIAICNGAEGAAGCEAALRPDLFFRLAAMRSALPPLRQRGEDVLTLFAQFAENYAEEYGTDPIHPNAQETAQMLQAPWPGNLRQLLNLAERATLQARRGAASITALLMNDTTEVVPQDMGEGKPLKEYVEAFERMLIDNTMRRHRGSIAAVMEELSLPRRTLNEKMAKYGLSRSDYL
ncbi:sigma-54 dependent transcriptional regulator [Roseovarius sp. 10]|uniref:sigma-54-dependent transcriptional regulator n=1 Tax=Roseovarius sp. 10 TaxID=3080563 RepID=UPI00295531D6|nr:sigma-54 dependent transcriptional regulator [Roseovarius sp. 10]MDV7200426.1 sigma-54 dependent transcriptional regulator [Roseovarius sp. 10]